MKILICDSLENEVLNSFSEIGKIKDISHEENKEDELSKNIVDSEVVVIRSATTINKDLIKSAKQLKIIARCGVGIDNIDLEQASKSNIYVTNSPNANIISVAELTIGLIIGAARNIHSSNNSLKSGEWNRQKFIGTELYEKQLGLIGFGKAANEVAKRLTAFGMRIVFFDPYIDESKNDAIKVDLDYLMQTSDVISIHVIKTKETENLIDSKYLKMIKEGGIIVNTSRGGIVDEKSLFELVDDKKIIFGGLDVYEKEPPEVGESFSNSNIITTPHLGASTKEAQLKAGKQTAENVKNILNGDLNSVINP
jgi:D-3-phosphoglycerate dehydrogenase|tara:strand:- start:335 stop:1264 length:930 start_codon:yes stop_codon:yes gene_type:complete